MGVTLLGTLTYDVHSSKWITQLVASDGTDPAANTSAQRVRQDQQSVRAYEHAPTVDHQRRKKCIQPAQRSKQTLKQLAESGNQTALKELRKRRKARIRRSAPKCFSGRVLEQFVSSKLSAFDRKMCRSAASNVS